MTIASATRYFIAFLLLLAFSFCSTNNQHSSSSVKSFFNKISGTWKLKDKPLYESWSRESDAFAGKVYGLKEGDTVIRETIRVLIEDSTWIYRVRVNDQNMGKTIDFRMQFADQKTVLFVNPDHDFPTSIRYTLYGNDSLVAETRGLLDGKEKTITFTYLRE